MKFLRKKIIPIMYGILSRCRRDNWKSKGYVRSDSHPRFFRTASKNTYVRDNSRVDRRGSNARSNLRSGGNFKRPGRNA